MGIVTSIISGTFQASCFVTFVMISACCTKPSRESFNKYFANTVGNKTNTIVGWIAEQTTSTAMTLKNAQYYDYKAFALVDIKDGDHSDRYVGVYYNWLGPFTSTARL